MSDSTLFIPDISGFSRFIHDTEINHSQHIIEELLTLIIDAGKDQLDVAEVEGDAVFFYKENKKLSREEIAQLAKKIFQAFQSHLLNYEHRRICNCGACSSAADLTLKFVVHSGKVGITKVGKESGKPFGEPVIAVHRLLKPKIKHPEYLLYSDHFLEEDEDSELKKGALKDTDLGELSFKYEDIGPWKKTLDDFPEPKSIDPDLAVSVTNIIDANIKTVHQVIIDFKYRHHWNKGASEITFDEGALNQVGTEHMCIVNGKTLYLDTVKPPSQNNELTYGEVLKNPAPFKYFASNFFLEELGNDQTKVRVEFDILFKYKILKLFNFAFKKRLEKQVQIVFTDLKETVQRHVVGEI